MRVELRQALPADMEAVLGFYSRMIDEMQGTEFDILWKHGEHPSNAFLRESVEHGYMYLAIADDGCIASALVVDRTAAPGYEKVPWQVAGDPSEVGIVHSVATLPAYHGQGFASSLMRHAIEASRAQGLKALRLDTFVDNVRSHGLYRKLGFIEHGAHPVFYDDLGTIELDMFEYVL